MSKARLIITAATVEGLSQGKAAHRYGVFLGWVSRLIARHRAGGEAASEPRPGRLETVPNAAASALRPVGHARPAPWRAAQAHLGPHGPEQGSGPRLALSQQDWRHQDPSRSAR